ncbi:hypothetical protein SBX64_08010 [Vibrio rhizosphaerae]|uniref:Uncharacterized protein n=1 Tax=Vibrio rhizosphaerae TaxID=398736 RepID=A0ABU4ITP8_9VIBR|nr:hypothetical protein [Vibrio rhizosphaerae]MDW6092487.1 hypothetical protein [Vibrio rhizosphaerae]
MKTIKAAVLALCLSPGLALAGTAYIPTFSVWNGALSCYKISNVSNVDASITVNFYDENGEFYTGPFGHAKVITALNTPFTLQPHKTAAFCLEKSSQPASGYGVIESTGTDGNQPFIIASGVYQALHTDYRMVERSITINQGLPF